MNKPPLSVPTESRPEPKFHVGQIVAMKGLKTAPPFRIIDMKFAVGEWCYQWNRRNYAAEHMLRDLTPEESSGPKISIEVYQQDWKPGFACFLDDGSIAEGGKAHVGLNLAAFLGTLEAGDIKAADLPYVIAESLMHEVIHVFESWAKVEFNEDRVEALLRTYHDKFRPDEPIYEKCEPRKTPEEQVYASSSLLPVGRQPLISECLLNSAEKLIKLSDEISEIEQHQDKHDRPEFEACSVCDSWSQKNRDFRHEAEHAALSFAYKIRELASLPVGESTRVWVLGKYENGEDITHGVTADREKALAWETGDVDQYASPFDLELGLGTAKCRQCKSTKLVPDPARYYVDAEIDGAPYYCRDCREFNVEALAHGGDHRDIINKPSQLPSVPAEIESVSSDVPKSSNETRNT